jgi:hypothetical protein
MYGWHPLSGYYVVDVVASDEVAIEGTEGGLGFSGDRVVFLAHRGMRWPDPEEESAVWRGVFSPTYRWKVLLEKRVEIQTAKLPRWQPQITLDHRWLSCEDVRDGYVWNLTILNVGHRTSLSTEHRIVDFRELYTVPRGFLESLLAQRGQPRLRLLPPYREHLSQAFARFFMRVGLPAGVTTAW